MTFATIAIENLLHLRVGREKGAHDPEHLVQLGGIGPEKAEEMPEKQEAGGEGEEELVGHLGGEPEGVVGRSLPNETAHDPAGQAEEFHRHAKFTLPLPGLPLNSPPTSLPNEWRNES